MESIVLDAKTYGGTYKLVGGEHCLDFVNTVSFFGMEKEHDWFDPPQNFVHWAKAIGLEVPREFDLFSDQRVNEQMKVVFKLRNTLRAILKPLSCGEKIPREEFDQLNAWLQQVSHCHFIDNSTYAWAWKKPDTYFELLAPVLYNAAYVITRLDHSRLGRCKRCDWLFYDNTRNKSRKWCDMEDCGSRSKALRYYHRTKDHEA